MLFYQGKGVALRRTKAILRIEGFVFSFRVCGSLVWWGGWGLYAFVVILVLLMLYCASIVLVGLVVVVLLTLVASLEFVGLVCWFGLLMVCVLLCV